VSESTTIEPRRPDLFTPRAACRWALADPAYAPDPTLMGRHAVAMRLGVRVARDLEAPALRTGAAPVATEAGRAIPRARPAPNRAPRRGDRSRIDDGMPSGSGHSNTNVPKLRNSWKLGPTGAQSQLVFRPSS
jgi:hypothetical protein